MENNHLPTPSHPTKKSILPWPQLGVDYIEAGFLSSEDDFRSVYEIGRQLKTSIPCALARALPQDIEVSYEALKKSHQFRIHTFVATSDIHVKTKLKTSWENVVDMARKAVRLARKFTSDVEFSCEDATRTSLPHLQEIIEAVIKRGLQLLTFQTLLGTQPPPSLET